MKIGLIVRPSLQACAFLVYLLFAPLAWAHESAGDGKDRWTGRLQAMDQALARTDAADAAFTRLPPIVITQPVSVPERSFSIQAKPASNFDVIGLIVGFFAGALMGALVGIFFTRRRTAGLESMLMSAEQFLRNQQEMIWGLERGTRASVHQIQAAQSMRQSLSTRLEIMQAQADQMNERLDDQLAGLRAQLKESEGQLIRARTERQQLQEKLHSLQSQNERLDRSQWFGEERRLPVRVECPKAGKDRVRVQLIHADGKSVAAPVKDLSLGGFCALLSPRRLLNDVFKIRFFLPSHTAPFDATATVAWNEASAKGSPGRVGFSLSELSGEHQVKLRSFLASLQAVQS